jgi:hypothetical protein
LANYKLHRFYLSYKVNGKIYLAWIEALNLRHAKEKILLGLMEATDIRDWTNERKEDLEEWLGKHKNVVIQDKMP